MNTNSITVPKKYKSMEFLGLMRELVKLFEPEVYVEIGARNGKTFNNIALMKQIKKAVAVDIRLTGIIKMEKVFTFQMSSDRFSEIWVSPIDLLFIDADHRYSQVKKDFDNLSPFVRNEGLILLHDTHPIKRELTSNQYCSNSWEFARDIHRFYEAYEIVTLPGPWAGLSIIRKAVNHLTWRSSI
jgi:hypothetical protein